MKIIMLKGSASSGKTTTLNRVYDTLTASCGAVVESPKELIPKASRKDFEATLRYNNKHVAIYSHGDLQWSCVRAIVKHSDKDILILACRNTFTHLLSLVDECAPPHIIQNKTVADPPLTEAAANTQDCNTIIGLI
jgi:nicotinamide riboside kinase